MGSRIWIKIKARTSITYISKRYRPSPKSSNNARKPWNRSWVKLIICCCQAT